MSSKKLLLAGLLMVTSLCAESKNLFALNNQYFTNNLATNQLRIYEFNDAENQLITNAPV